MTTGPDKSIAQLPGTSPNLGWASGFLFHLPRKMYRIYKEYCNSKLFSRCCGLPGKWLKLEFVRPCDNVLRLDIADLSDHCPVISLQMLELWLKTLPAYCFFTVKITTEIGLNQSFNSRKFKNIFFLSLGLK